MKKQRATWGMPIVILLCFIAAIFLNLTKPNIDDYIRVNEIRVVALDDIQRNDIGQVIGGTPRLNPRPGEPLFVMADVDILQSAPGQYRVLVRNLTEERNVFAVTEWSQKIDYKAGSVYREFEELPWWASTEIPPMGDGAYVMITEYRFYDENARFDQREYPSDEWVVN